jgi:acetyltransferase-like isoleucine patch superfamily enzyme
VSYRLANRRRPVVRIAPKAAVAQALRRGFWIVKDLDPLGRAGLLRRAALLARVRVTAWWQRATVELHVADDVRVGRGVQVTVQPRSVNVLRVESGTRLDERVLIMLKGGEVRIGAGCHLRRDTVLNVAGKLEMAGGNVLSWASLVHCAESVRLDRLASAAEHVTISDSSHFFTEPDDFFYHNLRTAPVVIGANTWLCPKATVTSGVTIGSHCIVASNSVVDRDVPPGHLASGVQPTRVRPLGLPWQ